LHAPVRGQTRRRQGPDHLHAVQHDGVPDARLSTLFRNYDDVFLLYASGLDGTLSVATNRDACRDRARSPLRSLAMNEPRSSRGRQSIRLRTAMLLARRSFSWLPTACGTTSSRLASVSSAKSSANGGSGSSTNVWLASTKSHEAGAARFSPQRR